MQKRRFAPSPAMVVSLIALFVALGGTSYAALSLPKNSVGTKQIKDGAVTAAKIEQLRRRGRQDRRQQRSTRLPEQWVGAIYEGDESLSFYKDSFGVVHLQGNVTDGLVALRHGNVSRPRTPSPQPA